MWTSEFRSERRRIRFQSLSLFTVPSTTWRGLPTLPPGYHIFVEPKAPRFDIEFAKLTPTSISEFRFEFPPLHYYLSEQQSKQR